MPWQQEVVDVALEIDPATGRLVYREVNLTVPRQSGKSTLLLSLLVHRALATGHFGGRQRIVYAAQTRNDARHKWEDDYVADLEASKRLRGQFTVRKSNGSEAVRFKNGSLFSITANTEKSGHGYTIDLGLMDEAFSQVDDRLEQAFKPAMITRPQPQLWVVSTAGSPDSTYLRRKVDAGRERCVAGLAESIAYFEWSAPEDADPADPAVWRGCMPALGHTVTEDAIAAEFQAMNLLEFQRAFLNQWVDRGVPDPVFGAGKWEEGVVEDSFDEPRAFAIDVTPDRAMTCVGVAGIRPDGATQGEVIDHRPGTSWVVERCVGLREKWGENIPFVVDPAGPAGSLIPALNEAGIEPVLMKARDVAQACGALFDGVTDGTFKHLRQLELDTAVAGATKRPLGDAFAWSRKSLVDISPLIAVTNATWGMAALTDGSSGFNIW